MKHTTLIISGLAMSFYFGFIGKTIFSKSAGNNGTTPAVNIISLKEENMKLGAFSVSLNVKDLKVSKQFYENLGFTILGGDIEKNYLIMKNEHTLIGLFQGMFDKTMLTFNPGWDDNAQNIESFDDVRAIQRHLKSNNIKIEPEADESTSGPAYIMLADPDGNMILIDQHR